MLTTLSSCGNPDASWDVYQPHTALCDVLVLATWPSRSERLYATFREEFLVFLRDGHIFREILFDDTSFRWCLENYGTGRSF